jgi:hypothetical protein
MATAFRSNAPATNDDQAAVASYGQELLWGKADNVGHCITLSVRSMVARDSFFLRVSIGSGAILAPLLPARNPTGPPN